MSVPRLRREESACDEAKAAYDVYDDYVDEYEDCSYNNRVKCQ